MESVAGTEEKDFVEEHLQPALCLSRGNSQNDAQTAGFDTGADHPMSSDEKPSLEISEITAPESDSAYSLALRELRFNTCTFPGDCETPPGLNTARVSKELKTLSRDLPCESTASIFVRMHENSLSNFRVLLSGSADTPYSNGLFLFSVVLPEDYPSNPPQMQILTTGNGKIRFNPNLYADGYLCLSVLNTWSSSPEEMWNPLLSSLFQVFISIQSLIMDQNVIQKEPGYEDYSTDSTENVLYRDIVRYNNMKYAMEEMIRRPPEGFEEVVKKHFTMVRGKIEKETGEWVEETAEDNPEDGEGLVSSHNSETIEEFHRNGRKVSMISARNSLLEAFRLLD